MSGPGHALAEGEVVVVLEVREVLALKGVKAGAHGVVLRPWGVGWLVRLDTGQQKAFLAEELEPLST